MDGPEGKSSWKTGSRETGTSSDYSDAWFIGYTPSVSQEPGWALMTRLHRKERDRRPCGTPIWISFMNQALKNSSVETLSLPVD